MEKRNDCFEEPFKKRARVILRPNGDVHIAFATSTSIQATARAVLELLQDPMGFIDEGCTKYTVTTNEICRRGQKIIPLEDIIGLDLAFITAERRVVCDFTEIFGKLFSSFGGSNMDLPLNMWDVVNDVSQNSMLDEKAFLLRYYLEVSKFLAEKDMPPIERHIKLRDEVQLAIIKIALNSLKYPKQKSTQRPTDVSELLSVSPVPDVEPEATLDEDIDPDLIGTKECAHILGITMQQVRNKIRSGEIRAIQADNGYFFISKQDLPTPKKRRNKQQKHVRLSGSWEEVQEIIRENN